MHCLADDRHAGNPEAANALPRRASRVIERLARGEVYYALGRFARVRRSYSRLRAVLEHFGGGPQLPAYPVSLFPECNVLQATAAIRRDGVACGLRLPPDTLAEIAAFAERQPFVPLQGGAPLVKNDVRDGRLPSGEPAVVGRVVYPGACQAVHRVAHDPTLLAIARSYLGYRPPIVQTQLHWSFVTEVPPDYRRHLGQTIDYHYDVGWFNFLYVFFYLTDVDRRSGAHAIIRGSHMRKPLGMLWHSARQSDDAVLRHYGPESEVTIEGEAGFGFVEDASGFHKALVPVTRERLAFFIHYG
jgi:hypothetical protein